MWSRRRARKKNKLKQTFLFKILINNKCSNLLGKYARTENNENYERATETKRNEK